jgi:hypothetical protein
MGSFEAAEARAVGATLSTLQRPERGSRMIDWLTGYTSIPNWALIVTGIVAFMTMAHINKLEGGDPD